MFFKRPWSLASAPSVGDYLQRDAFVFESPKKLKINNILFFFSLPSKVKYGGFVNYLVGGRYFVMSELLYDI